MTAAPVLGPRFKAGDLVNWLEGRTRKVRHGRVLNVTVHVGWEDAPEYEVQLIRRNGTAGRTTRHWQSELELDS